MNPCQINKMLVQFIADIHETDAGGLGLVVGQNSLVFLCSQFGRERYSDSYLPSKIAKAVQD